MEDRDSFGCGEKGRGREGKEETQEEEGPRGGGGDPAQSSEWFPVTRL